MSETSEIKAHSVQEASSVAEGAGLPMALNRLVLYNFKSYEQAEFDFSAPVICITGNNGCGKTNLLDAIHYLSYCKSYFNPIDSQNIRQGEEQCSITAEVARGTSEEQLICAMRAGQRKIFKRNHKEYDRLADHIGWMPSVIITPYDGELIHEGSEVRRKFLDSTISQLSRPYLDHLIQYNHSLLQRNNLLKSMGQQRRFNAELLEPWDFQLVRHGEVIHEARTNYLKAYIPLFSTIYEEISGVAEIPSISYSSDLNDQKFGEILIANHERDRHAERTTVGIHKDELEFTLRGMSLKKYASQGQQKSFLIALKLAQFVYLRNIQRYNPILMLDDLFDKLDESRVSNLLSWLKRHQVGQVFITDTHSDRIPMLLDQLEMASETWNIQRDGQYIKLNNPQA
jgi:DNA replication and repair protein RecF